MKLGGQRLELMLYLQALPVYARNLGVLLPPLLAAAIAVGLDYASGPLFAAVGGAGAGILGFIARVIEGYAFAVAVIFADDAWRHGRASLSAAWDNARRRAGELIIAVIGFLFLMYVAGLVGSIFGQIGYYVVSLLALWAFIYAIPAAAVGGIPAGGAFSVSLQTARRHPLATALIAFVSLLVWRGLTFYAFNALAPYMNMAGYYAAQTLLTAIALGYIALILARQYTDFSFRSYW
jgi:hypothetical protein